MQQLFFFFKKLFNVLIYCQSYSLSHELAELIRSSRPFMLTIAKAKTAKLSKIEKERERERNTTSIY